MRQNKPDGTEIMVTCVLVTVIIALLLLAYVPTQDAPTSWGRLWHDAGWPIIVAIVSTFISAFAGTWGAQMIAEHIATRKELLAEIRSVNAALALSFNITNTFVAIKKQHVQQLFEEYEALRMRHQTFPKDGSEFKVFMDLRELTAPFCPVNELRGIMLEKLSPSIKALMAVTPLVQSVEDISEVMRGRNAWIAQLRASKLNDVQKIAFYLGFEFAPGQTDIRYQSYMVAMKEKTDDCIMFPIIISKSLKIYGQELRKRYGNDAPEIISGDFQKNAKYLPDLNNYKDWTDA